MKTESQEQIDFIQWCKRNQSEHPELELIFHIPNGGARHIATASRLKLEGVKPGVPDLLLPVARWDKHGLFIEMKRSKDGFLDRNQKWWRDKLLAQGYGVMKADGFNPARRIIKKYLNI